MEGERIEKYIAARERANEILLKAMEKICEEEIETPGHLDACSAREVADALTELAQAIQGR